MPVQPLTPERRRQLTKEALIEAAADAFARRGFEGASLEEIAEAAGFTRGAIYSNFGGKEDLLLAVVDRYNTTLLDAFSDLASKAGTSEEQSSSAAVLWRDLIRRDPNITPLSLEFRLYALRNPAFRQRLMELQRVHIARISDLIARNAKAYGFRLKVEPDDLAEILNAATVGLTELASIDVERAERYDRLVETFFILIGESIAEETPRPRAPAKKAK
jgi:AcrR family transcriptional regulator